MFSKLFSRRRPSAPPTPTAEAPRLRKIADLDSSSPAHMSELLNLARSDPDPDVRSAAAARIGLREPVAQLLKDERDPTVRGRLMTLLFRNVDDEAAGEIASTLLRHAFGDAERVALLADIPHPVAAQAVAERIEDRHALLDLALHHKVARVRLCAARQLHTDEQLQTLSRRSSDKAVGQWVRAELKARRARERERRERAAAVDKLIADARQLAESRNPVDYDGRLARLRERREPLAEAFDDAQRATLAQALDAAAAHAAALAEARRAMPETAPESATESATTAPAAAPAADEPTAAALSALLDGEQQPDTAAIEQALACAEARLAAATAAPDPAHSALLDRSRAVLASVRYFDAQGEALCAEAALDQLDLDAPAAVADKLAALETYIEATSWPPAWPPPAPLAALQRSCQQLRERQRAAEEAERERERAVDKRLHRLRGALRAKKLRQANRLDAEISERLAPLHSAGAAALGERHTALREELQQLRDWNDYSTAPKREALCERMEALIEREQPPAARAEAVKALREQWRALDRSGGGDDALRRRFDSAAESAWAPCLPWFEQQAERRAENLRQRERIADELDQLLAGVDWAAPPFELLDRALKAARAEWNNHQPVAYPAAKAVQARFEGAMDKIHTALNTQRSDNAEAREALIARAAALAEIDDLDTAIERALALQAHWKAIGPVAAKQQRAQWRRFRQHMDAVFARRQALRDNERAEGETVRGALAERLRALAEAIDAAEASGRSAALDALTAQMAAIDEAVRALPRRTGGALAKRLQTLRQRSAQLQRQLPRRQRARQYAQLAAAAAACAAAEAALIEGGPVEPPSIDPAWQSLLRARVDALSSGHPPTEAQQLDHREQLEGLAIELEILAEVDTPDAFRASRRAWQLDLLESGGLGDNRPAEEQLFELLQRWYAVGALPAGERAALEARLAAACAPFSALLACDSDAPAAAVD